MTTFLREKFFGVLFLSVIFTFGSLLWTSDVVRNYEDLKSVDLGWPVDFASQEYEQLTPPDSWFPHSLGFGLPQEHSILFHFSLFFLAVFLNFIIIFFVLFATAHAHPKLRFIERAIKVKYIASVVGFAFFIFISLAIFVVERSKMQRVVGIGPAHVSPPIPIVPAPQEKTLPFLEESKISVPDGWYLHRITGYENAMMLTRQKELPDIGATESYAYGEQINIAVMEINTPWLAELISCVADADNINLPLRQWEEIGGREFLRVEQQAAGAGGKELTYYFFKDNLVYQFSLYPSDLYDSDIATLKNIIKEYVMRL